VRTISAWRRAAFCFDVLSALRENLQRIGLLCWPLGASRNRQGATPLYGDCGLDLLKVHGQFNVLAKHGR